MMRLFEIKVKLSPNQKKNLAAAFHKRETLFSGFQKMHYLEMTFCMFCKMLPNDCTRINS